MIIVNLEKRRTYRAPDWLRRSFVLASGSGDSRSAPTGRQSELQRRLAQARTPGSTGP